MQTTPKRFGVAVNEPKGDWLQDRQQLYAPTSGLTQPHTEDLLAQLDAARARLDASVLLLEQALDLREQLAWGIDLDDARAAVDVFKYACKAHRWWRASQ